MIKYTWGKFIAKGEITHHVALHRLGAGAHHELHTHTFHELFWGYKGECVHTINNQKKRFGEGSLILLRNFDVHEMHVESDEPCLYYLISFPCKTLNNLKRRYFDQDEDIWGLTREMPAEYRMPTLLREWLNAAVQELIGVADDKLAIERFLINLFYELRRLENEPQYTCPHWLSQTLEKCRDPEYFQQGAQVMSELCGRSYEHISRVLKSHTGLTPSEFINNIRVEYAASQLVMSDKSIAVIAYDCGFQAMSRFYSIFKKRYNLTPRAYRLRYRHVITRNYS